MPLPWKKTSAVTKPVAPPPPVESEEEEEEEEEEEQVPQGDAERHADDDGDAVPLQLGGMANMTAVAQSNAPGVKRVGRWTLAQLRQTDGIIPAQYGTNRYDSQKGMIGFGTIRNTSLKIKAEQIAELPLDILLRSEAEVRAQSGSNKYASQRGMVGMGTPRDVVRESHPHSTVLGDITEDKVLMSEGIVRLQSGTNRYASQKGMTGMGTNRRELTKMIDSRHPEFDVADVDQSHIPSQMGSNRFASQKGMTAIGMYRRELTHMLDTKHPDYAIDQSIDQHTIPGQMGSNKYASQVGMTHMGAFRIEVPQQHFIERQERSSQGIVPSQMGSNQFASQAGWNKAFGTVRNTTYLAEGGELEYDDLMRSQAIIPAQAGWNRGDSQKGTSGFGAFRDVRGKHLKRLWELEYPEEAEANIDVNPFH